MLPCVDIEGSGELTTFITATGGSDDSGNSATVRGASNAELRWLTVTNAGGQSFAFGIFNDGVAPHFNHVTVKVSNSNSFIYGVYNKHGASVTLTDVSISLTSVTSRPHGVHNSNSFVGMTRVNISVSAQQLAFGVVNLDGPSTVKMVDSGIAASGTATSVALYQEGDAVAEIQRSSLQGPVFSLFNQSGSVFVGASRLIGEVGGDPSTCVASYNGLYAALNASCL